MEQSTYPNMANASFIRGEQSGQSDLKRPFRLNKVQQKCDYMLKLIIVGDSGVGKTNIISAFCNSNYQFSSTHLPTIGVDFSAKVIQLQNRRVKLQVWDTAGQQRFRTITQTYYRGAAGILLVYSVGNRESFANVSTFYIRPSKMDGSDPRENLLKHKGPTHSQQNRSSCPLRLSKYRFNILMATQHVYLGKPQNCLQKLRLGFSD